MGFFDDFLSNSFSKRSVYTEEEIEKAKKMSKKNGKSFMENLVALTGKTPETQGFDMETVLQEMREQSGMAEKDIDEKIKELNDNLLHDFGVNQQNLSGLVGKAEASGYQNIKPSNMTIPQQNTALPKGEVTAKADDFDGVEDVLKKQVFGEDEFLKALVIAFKRPFILTEEPGHARNAIFLTGPEDTGKHTALYAITEELYNRKALGSPLVSPMDLANYGSSGADNVFLQDLYTALQSGADVLLFDHFDQCHVSYLAYLSELVREGSCTLKERYVLQNGQLVNVSNSFASTAVSSFSASGKYLVFVSTKGLSGLANSFGAPFINALGDVCETQKLPEESLEQVALTKWEVLKNKADSQLQFKLSAEEDLIRALGRDASAKGAGVTGILKLFDDLLKSFANLRLGDVYPKDAEGELIRDEEGVVKARFGMETVDLMTLLPAGYSGDLEEVKKEMDNIVGLEEIKKYILSLEEYYNVQKRRREEGLKASEVSKHMIFTGSPGTGKTTIARIISRYLKAIGVLSGGQLVEVSRADLVGRYVGHTAPLTNNVIRSAIGGVLFIDEAYSLYRGKDDSFGLEAIDTLVKGMEDNRDDLIVILAGYSKEMEEFMTANSGLKSRFPNIIEFPDYTGQELLEIAKITAKSKGYVLDEGVMMPLLAYFNAVQAVRASTAGNGRLVRNKIEEAILNQSRRLVAEPDADLSLLTSRDFDLTDING
ncbi:MAG: AAA family ATPase [Lachnospiraceae bacterium]|nr:AAA family ATPase [Lachnospiraceae bacterium]